MYISRIETWGLVKNKKEKDMLFIIRKKEEREAMGKRSTFVLRGRPINYEEAVYYFHRKGVSPHSRLLDPDSLYSETPSHIVCRSPSPPPVYHISEQLFGSIQRYYDGSFESGQWVSTGDVVVNISRGRAKGDIVPDLDEFSASCSAARALLKAKSFVEARRMLSTACALIRRILESQDPTALTNLFASFFNMAEDGYNEINDLFRRYISKMASVVVQRDHPWAVIWRLLAEVEHRDFDQILLQCWKCVDEALARNVGRFNTSAVLSYVEYKRAVLGRDNRVEEEIFLRKLLADCDLFHNYEPHASQCRILYKLACSLKFQSRFSEQEAVALDLAGRARLLGGEVEEQQGLLLASIAQHDLGKMTLAEETLRMFLASVEKSFGRTNPWAIQYAKMLESWLREWGREGDADVMKGDIEQRLIRHEVDSEVLDAEVEVEVEE